MLHKIRGFGNASANNLEPTNAASGESDHRLWSGGRLDSDMAPGVRPAPQVYRHRGIKVLDGVFKPPPPLYFHSAIDINHCFVKKRKKERKKERIIFFALQKKRKNCFCVAVTPF